ncbi:MAG: helix-turn-helix transcriptional regulator [Bacteroidales bacterium]|nr:helix-turn-helix transcriptional regulator [Bacteroidales bacterium]
MSHNYKLHIKNMVCPRCIMAVKDILENQGIPYIDVRLGEVILQHPKEQYDLTGLKKELHDVGFEMIEDQQVQIVERIKNIIIEWVRSPQNHKKIYNFSDYLAETFGKNYHYLSNIFSSKEGITIEKYMILQRIEYVKELLIYDEYSLSEIAWKLNYSSVAHLSNQFKQVTGFSPTAFKKLQHKDRKSLDQL